VSLETIRVFLVPREILNKTEKALRRAGRDGHELFVLWSGVADGQAFVVRTAHVPRQSSYKSRHGLFVRVDGEALHGLNAWLYDSGEMLAVQVHAHPTDAFHSDTDDTWPIVTALGGLSVVAPDFARRGVLTRGTAAYRLTRAGWNELRTKDLSRLLEVAD
jgi:hypothetical protein